MPPALAVAVFLMAWFGLEGRGASEWGVWMSEASDRVLGWLKGPDLWSLSAIDAAWKGHAALPPLPILATSLVRAAAPGLGFFEAARLISCLSVALTVPLIWGLGRRCGGPPGAATAVFAFILTPRILGLSGLAGFGAPAVFGIVFAAYALYRARTHRRWAIAAPLAVAIGVLTAQTTILALVPWCILSLTDKGAIAAMSTQATSKVAAGAPRGSFMPSSFSPWLLLTPLLVLPLCVALHPWAWSEPTSNLWAYFEHFLVHDREPFLYLGRRVTEERLPVTGSVVFLLATLPPMIAAMGLAGVLGEGVLQPMLRRWGGRRLSALIAIRPDPEAAGPEAREAKRWAFGFLGLTLALPWLAGSPVFGVVDLVAMSVPFLAVFAGCAFSRLFSVAADYVRLRAPRSGAALAVALAAFGVYTFASAALTCRQHYAAAEAYYSWIIGGPSGAVALGLPRYPFGPLPVAVARELAAQRAQAPGGATMAAVVDARRTRKILDCYARHGLVGPLPSWRDRYDAELLLMPHADADPAFTGQLSRLAASTTPERSLVLRSGGVRLFTIARPDAGARP